MIHAILIQFSACWWCVTFNGSF